jgi:hypothetical protein
VSRAHEAFDAEGALVNDLVQRQLAAFVSGFAAFVAGARGAG